MTVPDSAVASWSPGSSTVRGAPRSGAAAERRVRLPGGWLPYTPSACLVAYQPSAVASPTLAGLALAQAARDRDHAVGRVVVAGPAEEGQAAGRGELAVERQPELVRGELHGGGEARVEVDVGEVVRRRAGVLESAAPQAAIAGERCSSRRCERNHSSAACAPACTNTQRSRGTPSASAVARGAHDQRRRLVDLDVRVQQLQVRAARSAGCRRRRSQALRRCAPAASTRRAARRRPR